MAGDFNGNPLVSIKTDDNFHRVSSINPIHLAEFENTCDGTEACVIESITVTENRYASDRMDTGLYPIAAEDMKTKIMSRQAAWVAGGVVDPDFHETDEVGSRCAEINDYAIWWASANASKAAADNYNTNGVIYVTGEDRGPYNAGPLWISTNMKSTIDLDARTNTL